MTRMKTSRLIQLTITCLFQDISCCMNGTLYQCSSGTSVMDCVDGIGDCAPAGGC